MSAKTAKQGLHQRPGTGAPGGDPARRGRRQQAAAALREIRDRLGTIAETGARQVKANPVAAVAGAAAVSAGVALLLPSGRREARMMGEVAGRLSDAARDAAESAVEVARSHVEALAQDALAGVGGAVVQAMVSGYDAGGDEPEARRPEGQQTD